MQWLKIVVGNTVESLFKTGHLILFKPIIHIYCSFSKCIEVFELFNKTVDALAVRDILEAVRLLDKVHHHAVRVLSFLPIENARSSIGCVIVWAYIIVLWIRLIFVLYKIEAYGAGGWVVFQVQFLWSLQHEIIYRSFVEYPLVRPYLPVVLLVFALLFLWVASRLLRSATALRLLVGFQDGVALSAFFSLKALFNFFVHLVARVRRLFFFRWCWCDAIFLIWDIMVGVCAGLLWVLGGSFDL